jgi:hypothetical protein
MQGGHGRPVAAEELFYSEVEVFCMKTLGAFSNLSDGINGFWEN